MADRFDEMRARGINTNDATATSLDIVQGKTAYVAGQKITGSLVPSTGGDFNIFAQTTQPQTPNGVWIKEAASGEKYLSPYAAGEGDFGNPSSTTNLATTDLIFGEVVVGDYLYSFGNSSSTSYKYDLRNRTLVGNINVPTLSYSSSTNGIGAVYYATEQCIYLLYKTTAIIEAYKYYPSTDTYETTTLAAGDSSTLFPSSTLPYIYNGYLYVIVFQTRYSYQREVLKVNLSDYSYTFTVIGYSGYIGSSWGEGKYIYFTTNGDTSSATNDFIDVYRYDVTTNTQTKLIADASSQYGYIANIFATASHLFIFYSDTNVYGKYNLSTDTLEYEDTNITYTILRSRDQVSKSTFDSTNKVLYFRTPDMVVYPFQVGTQTAYSNGDIVVIQDAGYTNPVIIMNEPQIQVGVYDTYIQKNDVLDGNHMSFWGDGEKWNLLKNASGETCTVTFNSDGGSSVQSQSVVCGQTATEPQDPTKSGYFFDYWMLNNEEFDFDTPVIFDTTLTAKWIQAVTATFNSDGGSAVSSQTVPYGSTITEPADPTKSGYAFEYWTLNGQEFDFDTPLTSDITLVAQWVQTFTVTFDSDGGSSVSSQTVVSGETATQPANPTKTDYTFDYWTLNGVEYNFNTPVTANITLTASWTQQQVLPTGYTELSYIQTNGSGYINTGFKPNQDTKIETSMSITPAIPQTSIYGVRNGVSEGKFYCLVSSNTYSTLQMQYGTLAGSELQYNTSSPNFIVQDKNAITVNSTTYTMSTQTFTCSYNMFLFAFNSKGSASFKAASGTKMYYCKIWDNGTLVRNFVPAKRDSDNDVGLYDFVDNTFYSGSGNFSGI